MLCIVQTMSNSTYHHGDLKNSLIAAAREQIEKDGATSLNLRALARTLGVTHPAVYRHFADKEALLEAVAEQGFEKLAAQLAAAVAEEYEDAEPRLHALATTYVDFALAHPELLHVMFALIPYDARVRNDSLYAATKKAYAVLLDSVTDMPGEERTNGAIVWATMHGLAQLAIERQMLILNDNEERAEVVAKAAAMLSKGLS